MNTIESRKKTSLYIFTIISSIICSIFPILDIFLKQRIIDDIILKERIKAYYFIIIFMILFIILLFRIIHVFIKEQFLDKTRTSLIEDTLRSVINKKAMMGNSDNIEVIINNDITNIMDNYYLGYINLITTIATSIYSYIYALNISIIITMYSSIFMIITYVMSKKGGAFVAKLVETNSKYLGTFLKFIDNTLNNFRVIKTYQIESKVRENIDENSQIFLNKNLEVKNTLALYNTFNAVIYLFQKLGVIIIGGVLLYIGKTTPGELVAIIFLSTLLSSPIINLNNNIMQIKSTENIRNKVNQLLEQNKNNIIKVNNEGIFLKNQVIKYDENLVLKNFDLQIVPGKKYLLIGHNGSGKSSIIKLILSHIIEKSNMTSNPMGEILGLVSQNDTIIDTTISNNISLFKEINKGKIASILDVLHVEKDLDFDIDKNKRNISGGEIQRVLLGRAIYNDSNFLVLDEPFSALPKNISDELTYNLLNSSKTIIMASHHVQKDVLNLFDEVIFLKNKQLNKGTSQKDKEYFYEEYIKSK